MTKEEEKLLFTDLCSRIPYGVRVKFTEFSSLKDKELIGINAYDNDITIVTCRTENGIITMPLKYVKPYLYPLSSMTEEQKGEIEDKLMFPSNSNGGWIEILYNDKYEIPSWFIDFCNKNHLDYRGLIEKGLVLDATNLNIY